MAALSMAARRRLPQGIRRGDRPMPLPAGMKARTGLALAMAALQAPATGMSHDQALAERAQWAAEDEARRASQGCLPLGSRA